MSRTALFTATMLTVPLGLLAIANAQPVTGLYVGGAGGANFQQQNTYSPNLVGGGRGRASWDTGYVGLGSIGYGFGNGVRVELEGDYRQNRFSEPRGTAFLSRGGTEKKYGGFVNALFDLDIGIPYVFPYLGAGLGFQQEEQRFTATTPFSSSPGGFTKFLQGGEQGALGYQAIVGASFPIPGLVGLSLTAEYRFLGLAGQRNFHVESFDNFTGRPPSRYSVKEGETYDHSLLLGVRYAFNVPPPAVGSAPPVPSQTVPGRTYLVFFDWDRADLTDRARQIVAEAAQAVSRVQVTRIEVDGHADRSGTPRYNQGLSLRRANTVASELVRLGVPRTAISIQAFGDTRPLVPTAAGVREPQNRRVEIILR